MKPIALLLLAGLLFDLHCARASDHVDMHKVYRAQEMRWDEAPSALPSGARTALLFGDPQKSGLFAMRVKLPKGYRIAPHMHPQSEILTVISGNLSLGLGPLADRNSLEELPAGSFSSMPHGVVHYVLVNEDSVVQIDANGPWEIEYANPKDDPRLRGAPNASASAPPLPKPD
jgi:quercetin dioxygenase-like cupin family protein